MVALQRSLPPFVLFFVFFNDTATTEIYTLSLHDALPIFRGARQRLRALGRPAHCVVASATALPFREGTFDVVVLSDGLHRSEEHTSELQSLTNLVCRLLLEKKKK